jgi:hypothetical protein
MPRFSIARAMAVIALVAVNCAAVRALVQAADPVYSILFLGLLPLLNAQSIGLYLLLSRYRISLRRPMPAERLGIVPAFAGANALALVVSVTSFVVAPEVVLRVLIYALAPVEELFRSMGFEPSDFETPFFRFVMAPLLFGVAVSGPLLVLVFVLSWLSSRYRIRIVRRDVPAPASSGQGVTTVPFEPEANGAR